MRRQINIDDSIRDGKVRPVNLTMWQKIDKTFYITLAILVIGVMLIAPLALLSKSIAKGATDPYLYFFPLAFLPFGILAAYGLATEDKLKKITGKDQETNKRIIAGILKRQFKTESMVVGDKMITLYKRPSLIRFGTRVVVLFDGREVMINISRFNYYGLKSFFHGFFSDTRVRSITEDFNRAIGR